MLPHIKSTLNPEKALTLTVSIGDYLDEESQVTGEIDSSKFVQFGYQTFLYDWFRCSCKNWYTFDFERASSPFMPKQGELTNILTCFHSPNSISAGMFPFVRLVALKVVWVALWCLCHSGYCYGVICNTCCLRVLSIVSFTWCHFVWLMNVCPLGCMLKTIWQWFLGCQNIL